jgi:hypothetical protein
MARAKQMGGRLGREYWRGLVAQFESSPLGQAEFATRHGVNLATFRSWLYRLRGEAGETGLGLVPASFVEVVAGGSANGDEMACSIRVGAAELRFARAPSAGYLAELLVRVGT